MLHKQKTERGGGGGGNEAFWKLVSRSELQGRASTWCGWGEPHSLMLSRRIGAREQRAE